MAFCSGCGAQAPDGTAFCKQCGRPIAAAPQAAQASPAAPAAPQYSAPPVAPGATGTEGLAENVAGALCYSLWWLTGLIFFFVDKRPTVKFHAAQSIVVFGALHIAEIILARFIITSFFTGGWTFVWMLTDLVWLVGVVLWILLMVKAYQGEKFRVPIAADIADSLVGK